MGRQPKAKTAPPKGRYRSLFDSTKVNYLSSETSQPQPRRAARAPVDVLAGAEASVEAMGAFQARLGKVQIELCMRLQAGAVEFWAVCRVLLRC